MGVIYVPLPLSPKLHDSLRAEGIAFPLENGRNPTPAELRTALGKLDGITVEYNTPPLGGTWQADLTTNADPQGGPWTLLNVSDFQGEHVPQSISFEKGWPDLVIRVLCALVPITGPFVLVSDAGEGPLVISRGASPTALVNSWNEEDLLSESPDDTGAT